MPKRERFVIDWDKYRKDKEAKAKRRKDKVSGEDSQTPAGRVFGYGRVSTGRQAMSIQAQEQRLNGYHQGRFAMDGLPYMGFFGDDDTSGRVPFRQRDAGSKLHALLQGGDHVIVTRPDRAFRNMADTFATLEVWDKIGVSVHFVEYGVDTSTPMGKMMIAFLSLFADFERRMVSERTKDVNRERRRQGRPTSFAPVGYKTVSRKKGRVDGKDVYDRRLVIEEYEVRVGRRIHLMRMNREPWSQVCIKLREAGVLTREGTAKWPTSVAFRWMKAYRKMVKEGVLPPHLLPDAPPESSALPPSSADMPSTSMPSHAPLE
jgi:DNA invertase Pin-like site-specific DNA recombinase